MNPLFRSLVLLAAAALGCAHPIAATADPLSSPTPTQFARIARDADGKPEALQLAVVTYVPRDGASFSVDLISAVHIGDAAYYHGLNERFRDYDVLLYEMIIPDDPGPARQAERDFNIIASTQIGMKDMLGLAFQLDEIDYGAANFVHADLTTDMLAQSMADRGESLYVYFWRLVYQAINEYTRDPLGSRDWRLLSSMLSENDADLKIAMADEMVNATRTRDPLGGETGSALVAARNEHAVQILQDQIATGAKRIGIFYGAAHMTDFEERLLHELALAKVKLEWVDAWRFSAETT